MWRLKIPPFTYLSVPFHLINSSWGFLFSFPRKMGVFRCLIQSGWTAIWKTWKSGKSQGISEKYEMSREKILQVRRRTVRFPWQLVLNSRRFIIGLLKKPQISLKINIFYISNLNSIYYFPMIKHT